MTPFTFILKRLSGDWQLVLSVFIAVVIATSLIAGTPVYLKTLEKLGLDATIDGASLQNLNILTTARNIPLARDDLERVEESVADVFRRSIPQIYRGHERSLRTEPYLLNPTQIIPEPKVALALSPEQARGQAAVKGSLAYLTNAIGLRDHVNVVRGRMAGDTILADPDTYPPVVGIVEAVIGPNVALRHDLDVGDVVTLSTSTSAQVWTRLSVHVVGVVEAVDPDEGFWQGLASVFFGPSGSEGVPGLAAGSDPELPPAALIVSSQTASMLPEELVEMSRQYRRRVWGRWTIVPEPKVVLALSAEEVRLQARMRGSLGYLVHLRDLQDHVTFVEGRMAGDALFMDPETFPRVTGVEAVVGTAVARRHALQIGDSVVLTPSSRRWRRVSATIVGIVDVTDPTEEYWQGRASTFFDPPALEKAPDLGVEVDPRLPPVALIITPGAATKLTPELVEPPSYKFSRAVLGTASGFEEHVSLLAGRLAEDTIERGPEGPLVEAMLGGPLSREFLVGDVVTLTPFIDESVRVSARIVGVVEPADVSDEYWQWGPSGLFQSPYEPMAPMPIFLGPKAMIDGIGNAYPGTLVSSEWFTLVDREGLKQWSISQTRLKLAELKTQLSMVLPGHHTATGITTLLSDFERRRFLASAPLLLLLTTMVVTVVYFLSMMVSYLVRSRERDVAALKTRGVGTLELVRLYGSEGLVITGIAVLLAPFLAIAATAMAGTLPYFRGLTGGDLLPVEWRLLPILVAAGAGLLCLSILVAPAMLGTRTGHLVHRFRSARLPSVPFFHRYYLDIGLLLIGGLIFWELRSREQLVVGGLFKDAQVNEALLLAPVLFLTAVALLFIRLFPLLLRFASGESPALLHLVVLVAVAALGPAILVREAGDGLAWAPSVALLAMLAGTYWATQRVSGGWTRLGGIALQGAIVALFVVLEPPVTGGFSVVSTAVLVSLVAGQMAFILLKAAFRAAPAWVSLAFWHMARDPTQYTWLVLLLVLVTGLATFSVTVGATLDRRDEDGVLYDVAADLRVGVRNVDGWALREKYLAVPGVASVSSAFRGAGAGLPNVSRSFKVLAVESQDFASVAWYRDDFSARPLDRVMQALRSEDPADPAVVPPDATGLGVWAKLAPQSATVSVEMVVQDGLGESTFLDLGKLTDRDWRLMRADLPAGLEQPIHLKSLRVRTSVIGMPGTLLLDDVHATVGPDSEEHVLADFEDGSRWTPLPSSLKLSESVLSRADHAFRGDGAGLYSLGHGATRDVAGIYLSPSGGPLPVAVSTSFAASSGMEIGTSFVGAIRNALVPMVVAETVEYFPTMDPGGGGFVIADLELLLGHLSILDPDARISPNEFFLTVAPGAGQAVREGMRSPSPQSAQVLDRELLQTSLLESAGLDPLVTAGWRAMALLSLAIVVFTAGTGYVAYLLLVADRGRVEMDLVRSLGLRQGEVIGLLAIEHLVIVVFGMGLGIWAGLQMSGLTVPAVSLTETRGPAVPPILVTTDWGVVVAVCAAMVASFAAMLFVLKQRIFRSDLRNISRRAER